MNRDAFCVWRRRFKGECQSLLFYLFRIFPIQKKKIVFCCIEGTAGYSCNPKYIAEEFLRRDDGYKLIWLVSDSQKKFPPKIKAVHNSLWNRAYQLTTAGVWIDNSRKQLEVRKRKGQLYLQTWHAKLGFKPTCLDRGALFPSIAHIISQHDSEMIDYMLSNSDWYDKTLPSGMLYTGPVLRTGSPRCDILANHNVASYANVRKRYHLPENTKIIMYAPTFRGGSQSAVRAIKSNSHFPDCAALLKALSDRFEGKWVVFLRMHPQLQAHHIHVGNAQQGVIDISAEDDMYELLVGCDAFLTDYSSAAFDAAVMRIPIFLFADDYKTYEKERGKLLWNLSTLPFSLAVDDSELFENIQNFNESSYQEKLNRLFKNTGMVEDGTASKKVVDFIYQHERDCNS